jgi:hypothetical protein
MPVHLSRPARLLRSAYRTRFLRYAINRGMSPYEARAHFEGRPYAAWKEQFPHPHDAASDVMTAQFDAGELAAARTQYAGLVCCVLFMLALASAVTGALIQAIEHIDDAKQVQQQQRCMVSPVYCPKAEREVTHP